MARKKQLIQNITIVSFAHKGNVIGKTPEGQVVIVEDAVPGDNVDVLVYKKKKGLKWGKVETFNIKSPQRIDPRCQHFELCGGCKWQHLKYTEQLNQKQQIVQDALTRIAKVEPEELLPILGGTDTYYYRNKMEYTFSNARWLTDEEIESNQEKIDRRALGLHRPGMFNRIIDITNCHLQENIGDHIRNEIRSYALANEITFFDLLKENGILRNVVIRNNLRSEYMVTLVFYDSNQGIIDNLLNHLSKTFSEIKSIYYVINQKKNDSLVDQVFIHHYGELQLIEQLGKVKYLISPKSFFQTNSTQAKVLYDRVLDFMSSDPDNIVYDLYSGTGSIGLYLASKAHKVIGIEEIQEAVDDANLNAKLNNIQNAQFVVGKVEDILGEKFIKEQGFPNTLILDPPRMGIHPKALDFISSIGADEIIYVSCNPSTQARDLLMLSKNYDLKKSQAIDMFPHTNHIENIILLHKK